MIHRYSTTGRVIEFSLKVFRFGFYSEGILLLVTLWHKTCQIFSSIVWTHVHWSSVSVPQSVSESLKSLHTVTEQPFRPVLQLRKISNWIHPPPPRTMCCLLTIGPWRRCSSSAVRCCRSPAAVSSGRRWAEPSNTGTRLCRCSGPLIHTRRAKEKMNHSVINELFKCVWNVNK